MTMWRKLRPPRRVPDGEAAVEPVEHGPSIGERLRERRRERGLSYEDVERVTRINPAYIEALEDGDWSALPAPVYARGFMRSYARYLGLDPEVAVAAVPGDLPRPQGLEPLPGLRRSAGVRPAFALPSITPTPAAIAAAAGVLLVFLLLFVVPRLGRGGGATPIATPAVATPPGAATAPTGVFPPVSATAASSPAGGAGATGTASAAATVPPYAPGTVPDFTGVREQDAVALLGQLHLQAVPIEATNATVAVGLVFDQSPAPGTAVQENEAVTLFVSKGSGN